MTTRSPSAFVANAAGLQPVYNDRATGDVRCAKCGVAIRTGEPCNPFEPSSGFVDFDQLADRYSKHECGHCAALGAKKIMAGLQYTLIKPDGWYKLSTNIDIASLLMSPPMGEWMALLASGKNQHLAWKAGINYSNKRFSIRIGNQTVQIDHDRLMLGVKIQRLLIEARKAELEKGEKYNYPSIFNPEGDARKMKTPYFGLHVMLDRQFTKQSDTRQPLRERFPEEFAFIDRLSAGERWALFIIGCSKITEPAELVKLDIDSFTSNED